MYEVPQEILEVAKALGEETRFDIFRRIADSAAPLSVKELVSQLGMHHSAVRIHLNKLEDAGLIYSKKRHVQGAVGRPQLAFLPSPHALSITLPPRNYELLARLAVELASTRGDGPTPGDFGMRWGREHMRKRAGLVDAPVPLGEALDVVTDELRSLGASCHCTRMNGGHQILETNCVFAEIAKDHKPMVCDLHQGVARGMLTEISADAFDWLQMSSICGGDESCITRISPRAQD